jgi:hypothetical protein
VNKSAAKAGALVGLNTRRVLQVLNPTGQIP